MNISSKNTHRQSWEEYFFSILKQVQNRATCDRGKCGCLIISDKNTIVSTGYVGSIAGFPHCDDVGHDLKYFTDNQGNIITHCNRTIHAEQNAICQAAKLGISLFNCSAYTTICPCRVCAQMLIQSGITKVYFEYYYSNLDGLNILLKSGIQCYDYLADNSKLTDITYLWNSQYPANEHQFYIDNNHYFKSRQIQY